MVAAARRRLPEADLRVGDIQELPFGPATFDVVMSFNALQYAEDPRAAAAELARVAAPGGRVAVGIWGDPERCETEAVFAAIRSLLPPRPGDAPLAISAPGVVEQLLTSAGLTVAAGGEVDCPFSYPDLATGWRGQSAIGPFRAAIAVVGAERVRAAFTAAVEPFRQRDGSYLQENVFRYVIAVR
jgi:SAM-dependent methyltransferase